MRGVTRDKIQRGGVAQTHSRVKEGKNGRQNKTITTAIMIERQDKGCREEGAGEEP